MSELELLTTENVAEILHCSPMTVTRYVRRSKLPCLKPGRKLLFRRDDIENWIETQADLAAKKYRT